MIDCDPDSPCNQPAFRAPKPKKKKKKWPRINAGNRYRPGVYVDASMRAGYAKIVAVITLGGKRPLAVRMRRYLCQSVNHAEYFAITLGDYLRGPNKHLPIYSDSYGCVSKHPAENVVWVQRRDNVIADNWVRGPKAITIKSP